MTTPITAKKSPGLPEGGEQLDQRAQLLRSEMAQAALVLGGDHGVQAVDQLSPCGSELRGDQPTILIGDLNAEPGAAELQPLLARLRDAWDPGAGPGLTFPADTPVKRIDYVLVSRHFDVHTTRVPVSVASDHRPVVVDLTLRVGPR